MRRLLIITMLLVSTFSYAQVSLSEEQLKTLPDSVRLVVEKASELSDSEVSKATSVGKEIGEAVSGTLSAIEESTIRIADSNLGRTAIVIACWKLLWKDIFGILFGMTIFIIGNIYATRIIRHVAKLLKSDPKNPSDDVVFMLFLSAVCYVVTCIISALVIF